MCGRYYVEISEQDIQEILAEIEQEKEEGQLSFELKTGEIFPSDTAPVIACLEGNIEPAPMMWGFPKWGNQKGVIFNARAETALEKKMFRQSLLERRIAIPTSGFYEWTHPSEKGIKKEKYLFTEPGSNVLFLAGFYNNFADKDGPVLQHFTILTTDANKSMERIHSRMPVLLKENEIKDWITGKDFARYLERIPFELNAEAV